MRRTHQHLDKLRLLNVKVKLHPRIIGKHGGADFAKCLIDRKREAPACLRVTIDWVDYSALADLQVASWVLQ